MLLPPLPENSSSSSSSGPTPLNQFHINKRTKTDEDEDDDDYGDENYEGHLPRAVAPTVKGKAGGAAAASSTPGQKKVAGSKGKGTKSGSASAAAVENTHIPLWQRARRIQNTLALIERTAVDHTIESAYEIRGTGKASDKFKCEMCLFDKIGDGRATSICLGCSDLGPPQRLHYICWDHALQHGLQEFKGEYAQQCFKDFQDDGPV